MHQGIPIQMLSEKRWEHQLFGFWDLELGAGSWELRAGAGHEKVNVPKDFIVNLE